MTRKKSKHRQSSANPGSQEPIRLITDTTELADICETFAAGPYITIDTEFLREHTYYPQLCLVQVANEHEAVLIDPLAKGMELDALFDLLRNRAVVKVFHAARQDLEIFHRLMGEVPAPLFDTQVAAMVCGFGDQIGYDSLVNAVTGRHIDKSSRLMDWTRRPLTDAQLKYALGDVTHLRPVYGHLIGELAKNGRSGWIEEEMKILTSDSTYMVDPRAVYQRIKVRTKSRRFMGILQEVAAWRETTAQKRDLPRNRVLRDESLLEVSAHPPKSIEDLEKVRGIAKGWGRSDMGKTLMAAIQDGLNRPDDDLPDPPAGKPAIPMKGLTPLVDLLKVLLKAKCEDAGVAGKLVANASDLESIARGEGLETLPVLQGWRHEVFGKDALSLCAGTSGLMFVDGQVQIIHSADDQEAESP